MRYLIIFFTFVIAGCSNVYTKTSNYKIKPEDFKCPTDYFAYCEGRNPNNMECRCIDRQYQRVLMDRLSGLI